MSAVANNNLPSIYSERPGAADEDFSPFVKEVTDFCKEVDTLAQDVMARANKRFTINNFIPKIKLNMFAVFIPAKDAENGGEMDGATRALAVFCGGIASVVAAFIFGSFFLDFQDATARVNNCKDLREQFSDVWEIKGNSHVDDLSFIIEAEELAARQEQRRALLNMALSVAVIASSILIVAGGIFGCAPVALVGVAAIVLLCSVAMIKFGINFFARQPARDARKIAEAINRLKEAGIDG